MPKFNDQEILHKNPNRHIAFAKSRTLWHWFFGHGKVGWGWVVAILFPGWGHSAGLPRAHLFLLSPRGHISEAIYHCVFVILFIKKMRCVLWWCLLKVREQAESFQGKWEQASFFTEVKNILPYLLKDVVLLFWSLFSICLVPHFGHHLIESNVG